MHPKVLEEYDEVQVNKVFECFGRVMYQVQNIEYQIAILLATEYGPGIKNMTQESFSNLIDSVIKKTMGQLITQLLKTGEISPTFDSELRDALQKRNWLAHKYFGERDAHLLTQKGREVMIRELIALEEELQMLDQQLTTISDHWLSKVEIQVGLPNGFLQAQVQTEFEKILDEVKDL